MFWISIVFIAMSTLLIKLGALSVAFAVLALAFKAALVVIVLLCGLLVWRWYKKKEIHSLRRRLPGGPYE